jgi:hypothetical protein
MGDFVFLFCKDGGAGKRLQQSVTQLIGALGYCVNDVSAASHPSGQTALLQFRIRTALNSLED